MKQRHIKYIKDYRVLFKHIEIKGDIININIMKTVKIINTG